MSQQPSLCITGYYGRGNLGDDLLMLISYRLVRECYPHAAITIATMGEPTSYVQALLGEDVAVVQKERAAHYDIIVHGGGGVFFDYECPRALDRLLMKVARRLGWKKYLSGARKVRALLNKQLTSANKHIAIGVGVGEYREGSAHLRHTMQWMQNMRAIWVRDAQSAENMCAFSPVFDGEIRLGSDMVFMTQHWLENAQPAEEKIKNDKPRLGVVLRQYDRLYEPQHWHAMAQTLRVLGETYDVTLFFLEVHSDESVAHYFDGFTCAFWRPETMSVDEYMQQWAAQDVLLTSRAHGAICAACLSVPSVIIEIEPKLRTIHEMLPAASLLVDAHAFAQWGDAIARARAIKPEAIVQDVARNRLASEQAWQEVKGYV